MQVLRETSDEAQCSRSNDFSGGPLGSSEHIRVSDHGTADGMNRFGRIAAHASAQKSH